MKSKEVLELLQITRPTLTKYVKEGIIRTITLPNGRYDYSKEDVFKLFNKGVERKTYIYARVSTPKQNKDLENQVQLLKQFCFSNGWVINKVFQDVASGISFDKRKDFFKMLDDIIQNKVERVVITYKDRLSRVGFELFYYLFKKYHCEIIVMSDVGSEKLDSQEVFEEIVSLLHCYSMKMYSKRKCNKIKEVLQEED
ncbi:IS607 family transposase [Clostridium botulinum]|uniref:Site-specific recombinase, resolvase family n=2 Tax=Clostridium botulinum TaxID=1491 RepID=A0A9P2G6X6_CLOBO|nr:MULTISPECIES: IS607 family transposase [Clostridium]AYF54574.1 IS607 family transposase [Clostridium novyi]AYF54893.1 IS607 family transposase [Clostridium novyi]EES90994.1 site-specific recombinase, resolvase family [Clostridium botulinum D str. 1873]MBO3442697.1 IS607 family transposase [Clostridium haemolyticum]NFQ99305.1 IS607 family transposase [Clostridium botulinum]